MSEILSFTEHNWTVLPLLHKWFQIVVYRIRSNVVQNLNKQSLGNPVCGLGVCDQSQSIIYSLFASWIWMCIVFQGAVFWSVIMHTLSGRYSTVRFGFQDITFNANNFYIAFFSCGKLGAIVFGWLREIYVTVEWIHVWCWGGFFCGLPHLHRALWHVKTKCSDLK